MKRLHRSARTLLMTAVAAALATFAATGALAQNVNATIRGKVESATTGAEVVARETSTGYTTRVAVGADGRYALTSLRPGTYEISASAGGTSLGSSVVTVLVGQQLNIDLGAGKPTTELETVNVTAAAPIELRTSEVATNITQQQMRTLPQSDRNFLAFAALAPGVVVSNEKYNKTISAAGQPANQTNVFIDGANLKNNILQGGLVGQDSSRGNPFSQEAIQEFRVLTQNYKAEYEQAGTAIITAVTKSGTNEFHGTVYDYYQNKSMVALDKISRDNGLEKPDYSRKQYGATLGGPIVKDVLHFFVSYEVKEETGNQTVLFHNPTNPAYTGTPDFTQYNGNFNIPFEQKVGFGKLSWQPNDDNNVDLSFSRRKDTEVIGVQNTTAYTARQDRDNKVDDTLLKWQYRGNGFVNDMLIDRGYYQYSPQPAQPELISQDYEGVGVVGGASSLQDKEQKSTTFRNDVTLDSIDWHGEHVVKFGVKFAKYNLKLLENNTQNPRYSYNFRYATGYDIPYRVSYSPSGKSADIDNKQTGLFIQDDWDVTQRLQVNLGLRWDYESDAYNNDYVTPQSQIAVIDALGISHDYVSTGSERKGFKNAYQPRLGFSWDVSRDADQSTTITGGAGRYYDRTPLDNPIQESFHSQYPYYNIYFSRDGSPVDGNPAFAWDPRYLTVAGLQELIQSGNAGSGEINLLNNNQKPPYSDAFSLGVKQVLGDWITSVTLSRVLGYRQFTWIWGNRRENGDFIAPLPNGYGPVLLSSTKKYSSKGVFWTLEKPYTDESGWGFGLNWTFQLARKQGGDAYSLDYSTPAMYLGNNVGAKHNVVINGTVKMPWDMRLTGLITLNSGDPYPLATDYHYNGGLILGGSYPKRYDFILPNFWAYRQVDLALSKEFRIGQAQALEVRADAFNIFNFTNYDCYNQNFNEPTYGKGGCTKGPTRSFQVSARYRF
ncbi:MAG TPA: carboxypeptidase regulatory-like domain-containing protein [Tahibacter sp.]|nr:carboxypeptidase regulatory-like domain-containing protein [Tahibacter sp.]